MGHMSVSEPVLVFRGWVIHWLGLGCGYQLLKPGDFFHTGGRKWWLSRCPQVLPAKMLGFWGHTSIRVFLLDLEATVSLVVSGVSVPSFPRKVLVLGRLWNLESCSSIMVPFNRTVSEIPVEGDFEAAVLPISQPWPSGERAEGQESCLFKPHFSVSAFPGLIWVR